MDPDISEETNLIGKSVVRFIENEVVPLEVGQGALLSNERMLYDERGRYVHEIQELRRTVRKRSAEAGFYTMLAPVELGGGGLNTVTAVHVQETIARTFGPDRVLIHPVVIPSPFTNGLSPVLT